MVQTTLVVEHLLSTTWDGAQCPSGYSSRARLAGIVYRATRRVLQGVTMVGASPLITTRTPLKRQAQSLTLT